MVDDTRSGDRGSGAATQPGPARRPGLIRSIGHRLAGERLALPIEGRLASFAGATRWLNSEPLTPEGLRGRVVLVDFWTYTCVNWLRTLPYVRAWAAKYAAAGLTVTRERSGRSGLIKGIGPRTVARIVGHFGVDTPRVIEEATFRAQPHAEARQARCRGHQPRRTA